MWRQFCLSLLVPTVTVSASFFEVQFPNVDVFSEEQGNVTVQSGEYGNILITPGNGGKVYIGNMVFTELATIILSLPPIWSQNVGDGWLGAFQAGAPISVTVRAEDPEGGPITYERISGTLPANVVIERASGRIHGLPPDYDAVYRFGIRATDTHGKYADTVFMMEVRAVDQCIPKPCKNGGICMDGAHDFTCKCPPGFGGKICENKCLTTPMGVDSKLKKIPDAQLSAQLTAPGYSAANGRLNHAKGWVGTAKGAWLQVDLGQPSWVYAVATQNSAGGFLTLNYNMATSLDGAKFTIIKNGTAAELFPGATTPTDVRKNELIEPVHTRFVRFIAVGVSNKPGLRVEVYGCKALD